MKIREPLKLLLPWPRLTANKIWRPWANGGRVGLRLSEQAKDYFELVSKIMLVDHVPRQRLAVPLDVDLDFYPPPGRRADIDNVAPIVLDALTHAGVWLDDEWVERLTLTRHPCGTFKESAVRVAIRACVASCLD